MIVRVVALWLTPEEEIVRKQVEKELKSNMEHIEDDNTIYEVVLTKKMDTGFLCTINIKSEEETVSCSGSGFNIPMAISDASKGFFMQEAKKRVKFRNKKSLKLNKQDKEKKLNEEFKKVTMSAKKDLNKLQEKANEKVVKELN